MTTISKQTASQLQSEIMKLAHTLKSGTYIDSDAVKQAADAIALSYGYKSGLELQRFIGSRTQTLNKKHGSQPTDQQDAGKASPDLIERYIEIIHDRDGSVPLDWLLLREWTDVTATELRHARKAVIASGYKQIKAKGDHYIFALPDLPKPATNGTGKADEPVQGVLLEAETRNSYDALLKMVTEFHVVQYDILTEMRQMRGLMAKLVGVWCK